MYLYLTTTIGTAISNLYCSILQLFVVMIWFRLLFLLTTLYAQRCVHLVAFDDINKNAQEVAKKAVWLHRSCFCEI